MKQNRYYQFQIWPREINLRKAYSFKRTDQTILAILHPPFAADFYSFAFFNPHLWHIWVQQILSFFWYRWKTRKREFLSDRKQLWFLGFSLLENVNNSMFSAKTKYKSCLSTFVFLQLTCVRFILLLEANGRWAKPIFCCALFSSGRHFGKMVEVTVHVPLRLTLVADLSCFCFWASHWLNGSVKKTFLF